MFELFRSVKGKYYIFGLSLLVMTASISLFSMVFISHTRGDAAMAKMIGDERARIYLIEADLNLYSTEAGDLRAKYSADVVRLASEYDSIINRLIRMNQDYGLRMLIHRGIVGNLDDLRKDWDRLTIRITRATDPNSKKQEADAVRAELTNYAVKLNRFELGIQKTSASELEFFQAIIVLFLFTSFSVMVIGTLFIKSRFTQPLLRLKEFAHAVEECNFHTKAGVDSGDEFGELSSSLNSMAKRLSDVFDDLSKKARDSGAILDSSLKIMNNRDIETLLHHTAEVARGLVGAEYCAIGLAGTEDGFDYFVQSGMDDKTEESLQNSVGMPKPERMLAKLLKDGVAYRTGDLTLKKGFKGFPTGHPPMKALMCVPIVLEEAVIGMLYFSNPPKEKNFSRDDEHLAEAFAVTVALAIKNARTIDELTRSKVGLEVFVRLSNVVRKASSADEILRASLRQIVSSGELKTLKMGGIFLMDEKDGKLHLTIHENMPAALTKKEHVVGVGECLCGLAAMTGETVVSLDSCFDKRHTINYPGINWHGHIILPLKMHGKVFGVMVLYTKHHEHILPDDIRLYESLVEVIISAIEGINAGLTHAQEPTKKPETAHEHEGREYESSFGIKAFSPSAERPEPSCPYFGQCGGCGLQNVSYERQVSMKEDAIRSSVRKVAGTEITLSTPLTGDPWKFMRRGRFHCRNGIVGLFRDKSKEIIEIESCPLMSDAVNNGLAKARGLVREVDAAELQISSEVALVRALRDPESGWDSIAASFINAGFKGLVVEQDARKPAAFGDVIETVDLDGIMYSMLPMSSYQPNHNLNVQFIRHLCGALKPLEAKHILHLYSSGGNITLPLARYSKAMAAVIENPYVVIDCKRNLAANDIKNTELTCAKVDDHEITLQADVIVADPPSSGMSPVVIARILASRPELFVYLSSNPSTFSRDLKALSAAYVAEDIRLIDFMPHTFHIQILGLFRLR